MASLEPTRSPDEFTEMDWLNRLDLLRDGERWPEKIWGPPPGQPGCRVALHLLKEIALPQTSAVSSINKGCAA